VTDPTPREQALEMLSLHGSSSWSEDARGMICDGCSTRIQGVGLARHQIEILAAAALLPDREEWGVQFERTTDPTMDNPSGVITVEQGVHGERVARAAVKNGAPISARNRRAVHRYVTEWRTA